MLLLNGWKLETGKFPNGESWINVRDQVELKDYNLVRMIFEGNDDLINLMFLKRWIDEEGKKARLSAEYFPYSRMDRRNHHYAFSLKYVTEFINGLGFYSVTVSEPHSDVTPALLNNCRIRNFVEDNLPMVLKAIGFSEQTDLLFFPDAGAVKRYGTRLELPYCYANKERDFKTGEIIKYEIVTSRNKAGKVLIVDDLCSRGGTFLQAGNEIRRQLGQPEVFLLVAHCENNVFNGELLNDESPISAIFCSDSLLRCSSHPKIHMLY